MGLDRALTYLKGFLRPGGYLASSELTWLRAGAPEELRRYWREVGADIREAADYLASFAAAGYEPVGHFALPASDWWDDFYSPMEQHLQELRARYRDNAEGLAAVEEMKVEIDMHRRYGEYYGYIFFVARKGR